MRKFISLNTILRLGVKNIFLIITYTLLFKVKFLSNWDPINPVDPVRSILFTVDYFKSFLRYREYSQLP